MDPEAETSGDPPLTRADDRGAVQTAVGGVTHTAEGSHLEATPPHRLGSRADQPLASLIPRGHPLFAVDREQRVASVQQRRLHRFRSPSTGDARILSLPHTPPARQGLPGKAPGTFGPLAPFPGAYIANGQYVGRQQWTVQPRYARSGVRILMSKAEVEPARGSPQRFEFNDQRPRGYGLCFLVSFSRCSHSIDGGTRYLHD